ncbi:alkylmercury lyase family protein [Sporichthya polymorpha]|uniref:alkylmercury lyase family protein n=1 Tax=Sporichthya polymorpha TaxID=35751 RepID=UPI00035CD284|nr:alkylmercury lyase family protein [Sporichthya polymorpha]
MLITILSVPECPNVAILAERVQQVSGQVLGPDAVVVVEDEKQAEAWAMPGSPTLLLNGRDPFEATVGASVSCRLYLGATGRPSGAPDLDRLRLALATAASGDAPTDSSWLEPLSRDGLGRVAPAAGGLRAVQQALLRSVALTGVLPEPVALDRVAAPHGRRGVDVLADLADQDFLSLDAGGRVRAAYPFCLVSSRHRVRILGGATVRSMCAIDALGIGPMLGRDTVIESTDPLTEECIRIASVAERLDWDPRRAVVFAGRRAGSGPAELACCDVTNFFSSEHSAARWAALHTEVVGCVLDQNRAAELGRAIFAEVLQTEGTPTRQAGREGHATA